MMCIDGEKLTKDRIKAGNVFSANLVTEKLLPMADYLGNKSGYDADKMNFHADIGKGEILDVPILMESPVNYELEVTQSIPFGEGEVFFVPNTKCTLQRRTYRPTNICRRTFEKHCPHLNYVQYILFLYWRSSWQLG